jgi:hypothetical protein
MLCQLCALPDNDVTARGTLPSEDAEEYECIACGIYRISGEWVAAGMVRHIAEVDRVRLCGVVREDTDRKGICRQTITVGGYRDILARHSQPRTPLEQFERLVTFAADHSSYVGARCEYGNTYALARRLYLGANQNANAILSGAARTEYFEVSKAGIAVGLSLAGWRLAEELRREHGANDQAFIAMWFHKGMNSAFNDGFTPALRACGYNPLRIDQTAHTGKIDDEIISNIRKSRLLIADLTGCRPNVFYEAGFMHGLGRPVLYTCHERHQGHFLACEPDSAAPPNPQSATWFDQISTHAFDVRQYPVLRWNDPSELATLLRARLEAVGLSLLL